jgi:hypothetical protein
MSYCEHPISTNLPAKPQMMSYSQNDSFNTKTICCQLSKKYRTYLGTHQSHKKAKQNPVWMNSISVRDYFNINTKRIRNIPIFFLNKVNLTIANIVKPWLKIYSFWNVLWLIKFPGKLVRSLWRTSRRRPSSGCQRGQRCTAWTWTSHWSHQGGSDHWLVRIICLKYEEKH